MFRVLADHWLSSPETVSGLEADEQFRKSAFRNLRVGGPQRSLCTNRLKESSVGDWAWTAAGKVCSEKEIKRFVEQIYALQQINTRKPGLSFLLKGK